MCSTPDHCQIIERSPRPSHSLCLITLVQESDAKSTPPPSLRHSQSRSPSLDRWIETDFGPLASAKTSLYRSPSLEPGAQHPTPPHTRTSVLATPARRSRATSFFVAGMEGDISAVLKQDLKPFLWSGLGGGEEGGVGLLPRSLPGCSCPPKLRECVVSLLEICH